MFIILFLIGFIPLSEEPIRNQWCLGLVFSGLAFAWYFRKWSWTGTLLIFYLLAYCSFLYEFPHIYWNRLGPTTFSAMGSMAAGFALFLVMVLITAFSWPDLLLSAFKILIPANALLMLINGFYRHPGSIWNSQFFGFLNNSSHDASFLAACLPFYFEKLSLKKIIPIGLIITAILFSDSFTGIVLLSIVLIYELIKEFKLKPRYVLSAILVIFLGLLPYLKHFSWKFRDGSGRFTVWKLMLNFMKDGHTYWIGTGPGTFLAYGPVLQLSQVKGPMPTQINIFTFAHNEFLQLLFETGYIGLILALILIVEIFYKSKGTQREVFCLIMVACTSQFLLHLYLSSLFLAVIVAQILIQYKKRTTSLLQ